jgi:hypothetical protein
MFASEISYVNALSPYIIVEPDPASYGEIVMVTGNYFTPDSTVILKVGSLPTIPNINVNGTGYWTYSISIPFYLTPQIYTVVAQDNSGLSANTTLTISLGTNVTENQLDEILIHIDAKLEELNNSLLDTLSLHYNETKEAINILSSILTETNITITESIMNNTSIQEELKVKINEITVSLEDLAILNESLRSSISNLQVETSSVLSDLQVEIETVQSDIDEINSNILRTSLNIENLSVILWAATIAAITGVVFHLFDIKLHKKS